MRTLILASALLAGSSALGACASTRDYASMCERDYAENRRYATGAGAALGAAVGAALDEENRERGAAIGALAGGLLGNQLSSRDDPCGYGFGGYNADGRYGYDRVYRGDRYRYD